MATQAGLALSLYESNPQITCGEFVTEFALAFPSLPPKTAALYWQNKARRAKFGLAPVKLPTEYTGGEEKPAKKTKEVSAKKLLKDVGIKLEKPKKNRFTGNVKTTAPKTEDEVSRIKAANLARMKEITARNKVIRAQYNGNIARGADAPFDPEDFTPESARAELETADGLESFSEIGRAHV